MINKEIQLPSLSQGYIARSVFSSKKLFETDDSVTKLIGNRMTS